MRSAVVVTCLLLLVACDPKGEAPLAPVPPSSASVAVAPPATATPAPSTADRFSILQKTIDLDRLRPYWHPEVPTRMPLHVLKNEVVADAPALTLFGAPVVYVDDRTTRPFELTKLALTETSARVDFTYPREGVVGHAVFEKGPNGWTLIDRNVAER
jgi:hypothetical protein